MVKIAIVKPIIKSAYLSKQYALALLWIIWPGPNY